MWGDKLKKGLREAGEKVGKLTKRGKLEMDRLEAEGELRRRHQELGRHVALRMLEKGETELSGDDSHVRQLLEGVERAEAKLAEVRADAESLKSE